MASVRIICKASYAGGLGHLKRQTHLARVLRERGGDVSFLIADYPPAQQILQDDDWACQLVESIDQAPARLAARTDLVILDLQDTEAAFIGSLRNKARRIASFEDLGPGRECVDLLIDANLRPAEAPAASTGVRALFGLEYVLLHPDFESYHRKARTFPDKVGSVLISMGGTDPNGLTLPLAEAVLATLPDLDLTLLPGPGFADPDGLEALVRRHGRVRVLSAVPKIAEILFCHDLVLCAGGLTMYEALCVGTPAVVVSQVPHQARLACVMEGWGAALYMGSAASWDAECIGQTILLGRDRRRSMSRCGKSLIDGRGLTRIVEEISQLLA